MMTPQLELQRWLATRPRPALAEAGSSLSRLLLLRREDVEVLADVLTAVHDDWSRHQGAWKMVVAAADQALTKEAMVAVFELVLPTLVELLEEYHEQLTDPEVHLAYRLFVRYQHLDGMELLLRLARRGEHTNGDAWGTLLAAVAMSEPLWQFAVHRLAAVPPGGDCGVAFLQLCLTLIADGKLAELPQASARGCRQLQHWLADTARPERAMAALQAVPHLASEWQSLLLGMAAEHPDPEVRVVGLAVAAGLGNSEALRQLTERALGEDPNQASAQDALLRLAQQGLPAQVPPDHRLALDGALLLVDLASRGVRPQGWQVLARGVGDDGQRRSLVRVRSCQLALQLDRVWLLGAASPWEADYDALLPPAQAPDWPAVIADWPGPEAEFDEDGWHHRHDVARLFPVGSRGLAG